MKRINGGDLFIVREYKKTPNKYLIYKVSIEYYSSMTGGFVKLFEKTYFANIDEEVKHEIR